jgi:SAM-dependent methyltransferase
MNRGLRCPACASPEVAASFTIPDHEYQLDHRTDYVCCRSCGTLYQAQMPGVSELARFYPAKYHSFGTGGTIARLKHRVRLARLSAFLHSPQPVVLDYGCGDGTFITQAAAARSGIAFWGYEIAARKERSVTMGGRVTIIKGSFADLLEELPPCDLITMNHVIEHIPDPLEVFVELRHRLKDSGTLEGQTPAADSLERRVFGNAWSGFHAPRHTVIFSRAGLTAFMQRARFRKPAITLAFNPAAIAVSLASLRHGDHPGRIARSGASWLMYLAAATAIYPIDVLSGSPGIMNYVTTKDI